MYVSYVCVKVRQLQFGACDRLAFFLHTLALIINFMMRGGDRRVRAPVIY